MRAARVSWLLAVAALTAGGISGAQPAVALEPGVHIDPGSPAAKEYALPVTQARRTGTDTGSGAAAGGESSETLFGTGIKPRGPRGPDDPKQRKRARAGTTETGAPAATDTTAALPVVVQHAADSSTGSGGSSVLVLLAGAVAVLALGWFGGIVLRRSRRPTPMP
jgi:hypothetical protein